MSEYTQGICMDGAAILKDGQTMTIEEILQELRAPQSEWVSVDDRLPEESGAYWTFNGGGETGSVIIQRVHMFDIDYGCFNSCTVTHWMPLPTPPN